MRLRLQLFGLPFDKKESLHGYKNWKEFFEKLCGVKKTNLESYAEIMEEHNFLISLWEFIQIEDLDSLFEQSEVNNFFNLISKGKLELISPEINQPLTVGYQMREILFQKKLIQNHDITDVPGGFQSWKQFFQLVFSNKKDFPVDQYSSLFEQNDILLCHWPFLKEVNELIFNKNCIEMKHIFKMKIITFKI